MKFECVHVATCLPDYWSGHHLPHVQIYANPGMSLKEIKSAIRSEIAQGAVMGSTDSARFLSADFVEPDEEKLADKVTRAAYAAVNRIKPKNKGQRRFFTDVEQSDDGFESVFAYFVFVEI